MRFLPRVLIIVSLLVLAPLPRVFGSSARAFVPLSAGDLRIGRTASHLAAKSPAQAVRWLLGRRGLHASLGTDGKTVEIGFADGARLLIVPDLPSSNGSVGYAAARVQKFIRPLDQAAPVKAAVLLPFADELGEGPDAGQAEIDVLKTAGFTVDVYRNTDVSVGLLTHLADYSVVYLETHSGTLGDGDAILDTASTDSKQYSTFVKDGTVRQALAAGSNNLYLAITAGFIQQHVGTFAPSSLLYLDGCDVLHATVFWDALAGKGLDSLITWDSHVYSGTSQNAAGFMFGQLGSGATVSGALAAANDAGLGSGLGDQGIAHLGYVGDGNDTLARALAHYSAQPTATATPTNTPTATDTPTDVPTATPTPVTKKACPKNASKKHGKCTCKKGYKLVHGKCKKVKKQA